MEAIRQNARQQCRICATPREVNLTAAFSIIWFCDSGRIVKSERVSHIFSI